LYSPSSSVDLSLSDLVITGTILSTVCVTEISVSPPFPACDCRHWGRGRGRGRAHLLNHAERVGVVPLEIARAHERENRHDVVEHSLRDEPRQLGRNEQGPLRGSRVGRS
jgi:hypothetical protein